MFLNEMSCMIHIIQEGDTLYSISRKYNVPLSLIFRANPYAEIYNLQVGDEICVPVIQPIPYSNIISYIVEDGDTLESILERYGLNLEDFMEFNNLTGFDPQPGDVLQIPVFE